MSRTPKQRLARYRRWLTVNVALFVYLVLVVPPQWFTYGPHDAATVLPAVGALIAWWVTFIPTWTAYTRLPKETR